ncbi:MULTISPECIES: tRNA(1)(Val) (adenine(37)-N(6))-methyltransferase TrmN [Tenebrionibacter/Tenebrionicola group]|jgi:tRNA1Val (adenine37-N6)-methyltransferase|uniref:tRNA1(Val) (adenine(37)-N6)-methyltransferase n=2 Tax=Tenebrionibacter/Tenebrionicola group TaxID=2969848 RepID=A0A8K0V9E5_9ENTR|nr:MULTISPECIES: tRNA1(Val) (adenine(37)-N6)-methyltransferase [Tenebrionibacter/Tenebrionicola group]MBK4716605.1 tRNA1(Val) (adenine(37)-N6)-methyltransferase [Tenebrionibacter intestinalis]MBV4411684.1 tRNA1(Val) (adenine(37)-N6)-methyltransferase [Tenebrionicola larvae]MBV5097291.1 tRNA1(Val) (adenine(37)-N6)-methyltransferase [Tenebrionicola larvae]
MSERKAVLPRNGFTFKRFFVAHDRCAMKVGTDSILLGAWAPVAGVQRVLDIGTGCGLVALMLAQRTGEQTQIDAVELDAQAAEQARVNAEASPWSQRVSVYHADIREWAARQTMRYQLIVSNPPYYPPGVACASKQREQARYTTTLDHAALLSCAAQLITEEGFFCLVLPEQTGQQFIAMAAGQGWHCRFRTDVADNDMRPPHRVLLGFSPQPGECFTERLAIRSGDREYSEAWRGLTQDFYLFMSP